MAGGSAEVCVLAQECPHFLDKQDPRFSELRGTCESVSGGLCESGIGGVGTVVNYAPFILPEEEDRQVVEHQCYWDLFPESASKVCVLLCREGICFGGGQEQRYLKPTQFERGYDSDRYTRWQRMQSAWCA